MPDAGGTSAPGSVEGAGPVDVRGVHVTLGRTAVLADVDLEVRPGEVVALLGPNGAGKSTLLGVVAGDREPDEGEVLLDGRPVTGWPTRELARRRGVLLQRTTVSFPFTVREVVEMGRAPWAGSSDPDHDADVVGRAMAACDVGHLADRTVPTLSGGERARAALARVLAQQPPLLLLDEPTAALDLHHQEMVMGLARSHADAGGSVVVVLHDLSLAAAWADRVALLDRGRLDAAGPPGRVFTPERLSRVYGCAVEVFPHPRTGDLVVLPVRRSLQG